MKILNIGLKTLNLSFKEKVNINSLNQGLKFQTGIKDGQMHIKSLNLRLNFKPMFENLKLGLKEKVHINSSNQDLKFQTGVSASQMHINSLNPSLNFKPRFENLKPQFKK